MTALNNPIRFHKRLLRAEPSFRLMAKLWRISWLYVLLICALAGVGYVTLYSAAGGVPYPFAAPQAHVLPWALC